MHRERFFQQCCRCCLFILSSLAIGASAANEPGQAAAGDSSAPIKVSVPLRFDYPLLQQLLVSQLFTGEGQTRELLDDPSGCSQFILSNPAVAPSEALL